MSPPDTTRSITFRAVPVHLRSPQVTQSSTHQCSHERWYLVHRSRRIGLFPTARHYGKHEAQTKPFARQEKIRVKTLLTNTVRLCLLVSRVRGTIKLSIKWLSLMWTDYKIIPLLVRCGGHPAQKSTWCGLFGLLQSHNALPSTCARAFPW